MSVEIYFPNIVLRKKKRDAIVLTGHCENSNEISECIGHKEFLVQMKDD
jgi:hypothetical protein